MQEGFRRPFGRALQYFQLVVRRSEDLASNVVRLYGDNAAGPTVGGEGVASEHAEAPAGIPEGGSGDESLLSDLTSAKVQDLAQDRVAVSYFGGERDHLPSLNDGRPSAFLRARCPLCFGLKEGGKGPRR